MAFQVYYRKWRPQRFRELVSQEHVSSTLRQGVQQGRVAHSYLFCGPRGTGKTSTARVLAKAVNCLSPEEGDPCNACAPCQAVNDARFMDLIELDAASNRGIDEIRNIRDKVNLAPSEGRYKVYIIDEAHMLTEHASNAFLKTLEEPPPHAMFVLCTTEPQKILATIISRCQRFDFRRISSSAIIERLRGICLEEGVDAEGEALEALAHSAGGSLRDAENLLEQLVVSYGNRIGLRDVHEMLGLGQSEMALELTRYLLMGDTSAALAAINRTAWDGGDLRQLHRQTVELVRGVLLLQCGSRESVDLPQEIIGELDQLVPKADKARVMKSLKLLGEVNFKHDVPSPLPLELAVVELSLQETPQVDRIQPPPRSQPAVSPAPQPAPQPAPLVERSPAPAARGVTSQGETRSGVERARAQAPAGSTSGTAVTRTDIAPSTPVTEASETGTSPPSSGQGGTLQDQWPVLVRTLSRYKGKRFNIGALLRDCRSQHIDGETLVLTFAHRSHLERMQQELDDPVGMKTVEDAVTKSLGSSYQLRLTVVDDNGAGNVQASTQSPLVRAALSMGGRIMEERQQ